MRSDFSLNSFNEMTISITVDKSAIEEHVLQYHSGSTDSRNINTGAVPTVRSAPLAQKRMLEAQCANREKI